MVTSTVKQARRTFEDACAEINFYHREGNLERAWVAGDNLREAFLELDEALDSDDDIKKRMDYHYRYSLALRTLSDMEGEPHKGRLLHEAFNLLAVIRECRVYMPERFLGEDQGSTASFINDAARQMIECGWFDSAAEWAKAGLDQYEQTGEADGVAIGRLNTHLTRLQALTAIGDSARLSDALQEALALAQKVENGYCASIMATRLTAEIRSASGGSSLPNKVSTRLSNPS